MSKSSSSHGDGHFTTSSKSSLHFSSFSSPNFSSSDHTREAAHDELLIASLVAVELVSVVPLYAMSLYVVRVMCTTSILHLNLRLLFAWHALVAMAFGAGRAYFDIANLCLLNTPQFPYAGSTIDGFLFVFGAVANTYVTPALVIERIMATRGVDNYERRQGGHYALYTLMLLTLLAAAWVAWIDVTARTHGQALVDSTGIIMGLLSTAVGVAIYLILLAVLRHNEHSYKMEQLTRGNHVSLSKRYQRSENIRAIRQLLPVTLLHVLQNIPPCVFLTLCWIGMVRTLRDFVVYTTFATVCLSCFYLALQITIITSHPTLRRDAYIQLRRWLLCCNVFGICEYSSNRVSIAANSSNNPGAIGGIGDGGGGGGGGGQLGVGQKRVMALKRIDGRELLPRSGVNRQEEHFKNLAAFWAVDGPQLR